MANRLRILNLAFGTGLNLAPVNPTSCCNGAIYNTRVLRAPIFMSPESTLTMEGFHDRSQIGAADFQCQARKACR